MRNYTFEIKFKTKRKITLSASCKKTARILAQAIEIKNGNDYDIVGIKKLSW